MCFATGYTGTNDNTGGGDIIATPDAGATWSTKTLTPWYEGLGGIACPSTSTCYAGDNNTPTYGEGAGNILATHNAGNTRMPHAARRPGEFVAVACPSVIRPSHRTT